MKKSYSKPILELVDIAPTTKIALVEVSQASGVLNFTDNPGDTMGWNEFYNK